MRKSLDGFWDEGDTARVIETRPLELEGPVLLRQTLRAPLRVFAFAFAFASRSGSSLALSTRLYTCSSLLFS